MKRIIGFIVRTGLLTVVYLVLFSAAYSIALSLSGAAVPATGAGAGGESETAWGGGAIMLLLAGLLNAAALAVMIVRSRWHGHQLALTVALVLYGVLTFMTQVEAAVFPAVASRLGEGMLRALFLAGSLLAIPFAPLAVLVMGKWRAEARSNGANHRLEMLWSEWLWKLALLAVIYVGLYFTFGYFVAWRNPVISSYYGGTDPGSFIAQLVMVAQTTPWMYAFQFARGIVWVLIALPIVRMTKGGPLETGAIVGLQFAVLMNSSLLLPNPAMPEAVRMVHLVETAPSNFIMGVLTALVLSWRENPMPTFSRPAPILR